MNINKTMVTDSDSVVFAACISAEKDTLPLDFFHNEEEREEAIIQEAKKRSVATVLKIQELTGCEKVECYFTAGKCFRYDVSPEYKDNRKKLQRPVGLKEVREYLNSQFDGEILRDIEADDFVVWRGKQENTLVVAQDKDILGQLEGTHFNYHYKTWDYVTTTSEQAKKFLWLQMIIGDATDNIKGIHRMGVKKAEKHLEDVEDYRQSVYDLYVEKGREKDFIMNLNLLDMHLLQDDMTIKLHKKEKND